MKTNPAKAVQELVCMLSFATDIENDKKIYHAWRVGILAALIAEQSLPAQRKNVFYAALMHDLGGVGFPLHVIHYLSKHTAANQNILLSHPIIGAQLVSRVPGFAKISQLIIDHHEWVNGHGYPRAKTKPEIPLGAQIIRLSDAVDIALRGKTGGNLKNLTGKLALNIDKEYSRELCSKAIMIIKKHDLLNIFSDEKNFPAFFESVKKSMGPVPMGRKIDAVGACLDMIAQIIDMKHPYTYGHSQRVSRYAVAVALVLRIPHDEITMIKWAGLLHDIGKITRLRTILDKPEKLNRREREHIKEHAIITEEILNMLPAFKEVIPLAAGHHEFFDGSGYPHGLKGNKIPLGTRIITVCDAFDAMTSNRPYRNAMVIESACEQILANSGTQFDPHVVKSALPIFRNLNV